MPMEIILNVITLLFLIYIVLFKNYFRTKEKNLANKEDISDITKITEETNFNFSLFRILPMEVKKGSIFNTEHSIIMFSP